MVWPADVMMGGFELALVTLKNSSLQDKVNHIGY